MRGLLLRRLTPFSPKTEVLGILCGISSPFGELFPIRGQIIHVLRTRAPCAIPYCYGTRTRLACVKHAASVRSEPGSNSRLKPVAWRKKYPGFIRDQPAKQIVDRSMLLNHSGSNKAEWFRTDSGTSYKLSKSYGLPVQQSGIQTTLQL